MPWTTGSGQNGLSDSVGIMGGGNGVLEIMLSKREEAKAKQIKVAVK